MPCYLVSYDLNNGSDTDYMKIIAECDLMGHHAMDSLFLIEFDGDTATLIQKLAQYVDGDDHLLVTKLTEKPLIQNCNPGTQGWIDRRF